MNNKINYKTALFNDTTVSSYCSSQTNLRRSYTSLRPILCIYTWV